MTRIEVVNYAIYVLGTEGAERWLMKPAIGLNWRIPWSVMGESEEGLELVRTYLEQMEHGVYV